MAEKNTAGNPLGLISGVFQNASDLLRRSRLAGKLGKQFGGDRDLYDALGYKLEPDITDYRAFYDRQEIAGRAVDLPAQDTWRRPPVIVDGEARTDSNENETDFTRSLREIISKRRLWHYLERVDRLAGIGAYGILVIGTGGELSQEVSGEDNTIAYLMPYAEDSVKIKEIDDDAGSERFGLPTIYELTIVDASTGKTNKRNAHWSRVIHVADGKTDSEVFGTPRLQRVFNRLYDLEKVIGASSEGAWLSAFKGLAFILKDEFEFPEKTETGGDAQAEVLDEIEEYVHNLRRFMRLQGMEIHELGTETVPDPSGLAEVLFKAIAAGVEIPNRILVGSERGELASSQDQATWAGLIASRQTTFAEPEVLRPLIDWCITHGVIPAPNNEQYEVEWSPIFELSDLEKAERAQRYGDAINKGSGGLPDTIMRPQDFGERYLDYEMPEGEFDRQPGDDDIDASADADAE